MPSAKPQSTLSLTEQLALLEDPAPSDFDPEALEQERWDSEGSDESEGSGNEGEHSGREHYVAVGEGKLRKGHLVLLDPKYNGAKVSRDKLYDSDEEHIGSESGRDEDGGDEGSNDESTGGVGLNSEEDIRAGIPLSDEDDEIGSDDALGSEEEEFSSLKFRGSTTTLKTEGMANSSGESSGGEDDESDGDGVEDGKEDLTELGTGAEGDEDGDHDEDDDEPEDEDERSNDQEEVARRTQLRKMMAEEQKNVVANITKAVKADADKGAAVRQQQKTFDSFLSVRIKLQKALISTNSLSGTPAEPESWKAAEGAALELWNVLHDLRCDLSDLRSGIKRKRDNQDKPDTTTTTTTTTDSLSAKMRKLERDTSAWRETTLDKWSNKTQGVTTTTLTKKLNNTISAPRQLTASIRETLSSDQDRLIARTRTPRSMAPTCTVAEDPEIFDDTDFYQLLLKALVDSRMVDGGVAAESGVVRWTTAIRDAKKRKVVDTRSSKGRKLRYQVQEKIQNFMAPLENNTWQEQQIDELFSSLLGQKVKVDEKDENWDEEDIEMDGLRLFRG